MQSLIAAASMALILIAHGAPLLWRFGQRIGVDDPAWVRRHAPTRGFGYRRR